MSADAAPRAASNRQRFTFAGNVRQTRHGWLRLTPAYSVHLVGELLDTRDRLDAPVLDPFSGTGTTLLACAERGIDCDAVDINPFLVWLAKAKCARYATSDIDEAHEVIERMARSAKRTRGAPPWVPPIHRIERWWSPATATALGRARAALDTQLRPRVGDLARLAFCRALIQVAEVSFGHQSMSFRRRAHAPAEHDDEERVARTLNSCFDEVARAASSAIAVGRRRVVHGDARNLDVALARGRYGLVITSPPYANRMSYIRELRPYMYWLGFLGDRSSAGELDWRAIGGTWGAATSRLMDWQARPDARSPLHGFASMLERITAQSEILGRYVHRYFDDMELHVRGLFPLVKRGGQVHYVVGNSKFFDVVVPVERLLAAQLEQAGFRNATVERLRKRTSKPELYEFLVSAIKPRASRRGNPR